MIMLNERKARKLKVGDEVIYKERDGDLRELPLRARVLEVYPNHIELDVAATRNPFIPFEQVTSHFTTSFCFRDCCEYGRYRLYRETESSEDIVDALLALEV